VTVAVRLQTVPVAAMFAELLPLLIMLFSVRSAISKIGLPGARGAWLWFLGKQNRVCVRLSDSWAPAVS